MRFSPRHALTKAVALTALFCMSTQTTLAAYLVLANQPLFIGANVPPQVMLTISKDQQLFKKAYNDYSDLDGDGQIETTYKHSVDYYGYFDPTKCYDYNAAANRFDPVSVSPTKYCTGQWSGNFLNWVAMSRMDAVRKLLYGGKRSVDTTSTTVLERAYFPSDAHAWAKYYNGSDIPQLTPFTAAQVPTAPVVFTASTAKLSELCGAISPGTTTFFSTVVGSGGTPSLAAINADFQVPPLLTPITGSAWGPCTPTPNSGGWGLAPGAPSPAFIWFGHTGMVAKPGSPSVFTHPWFTNGGQPPNTPPVPFPVWDVDVTFTSNMAAGTNALSLGDQIRLESAVFASRGPNVADCSGPTTPCLTGTVIGFSNGNATVRLRIDAEGVVGAGASSVWHVTNFTRTGISFCNVTLGSGGANNVSHTNTNPPLIRVARGNFQLWNANEVSQCHWAEERTNQQSGFNGIRSNGNLMTLSGITASAENPSQVIHGLGTGSSAGTLPNQTGTYVARVRSCVTGLFGAERCKQYPNGNYKPIGLLQEYGDVNLIHFGLMTGSYSKNISGGVLRKNVGSFTDEVDQNTGVFTSSQSSGNAATPPGSPRSQSSSATTPGIVSTLNYMRIFGYNYTQRNYLGAGGDNCSYQLTNIVENDCTSWGNPMSEIYFESLRYLAGKAPASAYDPGATSKDNQLGLPRASWNAPLNNDNYCSPLNVLVFNASVSTNDDDLGLTSTGDINGSDSVSVLSNKVGDAEGITNNWYFVGKLLGSSATPASDAGFELCTPKNIPGLGDVSGICPEGPTLAGSYLMPGLAHHARTNRIGTDVPAVPGSDTRSLKVTTYGVQLATNVPQLIIPVPGATGGQKVVIQPIYRLVVGTRLGGGALVDMKFVRQQTVGNVSTGRVYINWEDSEQGGDYDQDMWGVLEWRLDAAANTITITTNAVSAATANPQGFGYTISGTTKDGPHFHSGILGFNYTDPTGVLGCTNCQVARSAAGQRGPTSVTYNLGSSSGGTLQDPMWYAAKFGGFADSNGNNLPDVQSEWDSRLANGGEGSDGIPDNYFLVTNPLGLVDALNRAMVAILANASASSVATNSTSLQTGTTIYQARFNANDWSGQVLAFPVAADGSIAQNPLWDAGRILNSQDPVSTVAPATTTPSTSPAAISGAGRAVITYNDSPAVRDGVPFRWPVNPASPTPTEIGANLVNALNIQPGTATNDGRGSARLAYLRGSPANEGTGVTNFRQRPTSKLGDVVNSNPNFIGAPNSGFGDSAYVQFRQDNINRQEMVYVGGNDGMLHAFRASDGRELLAYVPSMVHDNLNILTDKTYVGNQHRYFVDGSPEVSDAFINKGGTNQWRTVLVSGLGAGGQGLFALDITRPDQFSEANAADIVLWEFSDKDDPDLGYVTGQPVIRQMANGRWAAIVPGGYNNSQPRSGEIACTDSPTRTPSGCTTSSTGDAYLYIIFLDGPSGPSRTWVEGTDYIKITTTAGSAATPNGLTQPLAADINADGVIDFVYAGDLRGNLWKFDLTNANPATWTSSSNRVRLFIARDADGVRQPITAKPEGTLHPSGQGFIIAFGTGKYLEPTDPFPPGPSSPYQVQSFYGIWDKNDASPISGQTQVTSRAQLLPHEITAPSGSSFRVVVPVSGNPDIPDWSTDTTPPGAEDAPPKHMGWRLDFPNAGSTGERSVFRPILNAGRLVFTTLLPLTQACQFGGTSFLMVLDPVTGGRIDAPVLDVDANGLLNASDTVSLGGQQLFASGVQSTIGITPTPTIIRSSGLPAGATGTAGSQILGTSGPLVAASGQLLAYAITAGSSSGNASTMIGLSAAGGRVSWRELMADP